MFRTIGIAALLSIAVSATAQWQMQDSHTTAGLRGIHSVDGRVAWASGTKGTILRTEDGGQHWTQCAVPPDADKLDFRGVWAWDAKWAKVMSIGPGEASRIYKTSDGCAHWTEERRNAIKEGFWDAMVFSPKSHRGVLVGDPVNGRFYLEVTGGSFGWQADTHVCNALPGDGAFAASNSSVAFVTPDKFVIGTGGTSGARVLFPSEIGRRPLGCPAVSVPMATPSASSGIFSIAFRDSKHGIVAGGDYQKPNESTGSAAWTSDGGLHWTAASKMPHGFRSSVAWDAKGKFWIAAGTNGSDISRDDGKTWQPLDDGNWNALSLPFVVGPNGRIARLTPDALKK